MRSWSHNPSWGQRASVPVWGDSMVCPLVLLLRIIEADGKFQQTAKQKQGSQKVRPTDVNPG